MLDGNDNIQHLDLSFNLLGPLGVGQMCEQFHKFTGISALRLSGNLIGDVGARTLARAMEKYRWRISHLDLAENKIGRAGVAGIAKHILNAHLHTVFVGLAGNRLDNVDAKVMGEAITNNRIIRGISLRGNLIDLAGSFCSTFVSLFRVCLLSSCFPAVFGVRCVALCFFCFFFLLCVLCFSCVYTPPLAPNSILCLLFPSRWQGDGRA